MLIPLDEQCHFDVATHDPATASVSDADSAPTYAVFEEANDTPILSAQSFTKRTSLTGDYRGSFTLSAANGFEVGKFYNVVASATVGGITGKKVCLTFRCVVAETTAGYPRMDVADVFARAFSSAYGSYTFDQLVKMMAAVLLGKASGQETTTGRYRNLADNADVIVATQDASGNRSSVTRTP